MRLLVSCIPYDRGKSGISVYVRETVRALAAQGHELTLLVEPGDAAPPPLGETRRVTAPGWTRRPALSMLWHLLALPLWIRRHRREFDGLAICAANRRACAWYPLPTAATVHDLANFRIPGKYSRMRMFYLARVLPRFAKKAQRLVAVSGATKADMVKYWKCREDDVTVLYNGFRTSDVGRRTCPGSPKSAVRSLLYISRIEHPGKNHVRLIEAYGRLSRELAEAHPLVLAGADWKDAEAVHASAAASPYAHLVRFTGFVPEDEMERLWEKTGFYVFPSLFEGFGLSLVEAMARGIPCACSNNGSLGEIAGDVAITFDPESVEEIATALERLLTEPPSARTARISRGLEWAMRFSWTDHAAGLVALIAEAGNRRRESRHASCVSCASTASLFGISVAKMTEPEAVARVVALAKAPRTGKAARVATLNVDFVCNAVRGWPFGGNDELWGYLKDADLVTADGMPIVLLSRMLLNPLPERVTGADMVPAICRRCAEEGLSVYVLGGDEGVVEEAFSKMGIDGLRIAGIDPAFVKIDGEQSAIISRINAAKPDVLFVALGNPRQELWMGRNATKVAAGVMIGVGGTFNFIAGRVKRAPRWMQRSGLEWTYRIVQEPGRLWKRYSYGLVKFSYLSILQLCGRYHG